MARSALTAVLTTAALTLALAGVASADLTRT